MPTSLIYEYRNNVKQKWTMSRIKAACTKSSSKNYEGSLMCINQNTHMNNWQS